MGADFVSRQRQVHRPLPLEEVLIIHAEDSRHQDAEKKRPTPTIR